MTTDYLNKRKTLCWDCSRAAGYDGGCNWSNYCIGKCETPEVDGWNAIKGKMEHKSSELSKKDGGLTYCVISCPEFVADEKVKKIYLNSYRLPCTIKMYAASENEKTVYYIDIINDKTNSILFKEKTENIRKALEIFDAYTSFGDVDNSDNSEEK